MPKSPRVDTFVRKLVLLDYQPDSDEAKLSRKLHPSSRSPSPIFRPFDQAAKKGTLPPKDKVHELAQVAAIPQHELNYACLLDAGIEIEPKYDAEQRRAAHLVLQVPAGRRGELLDLLEAAVALTRESGEPS